METYKTVSTSGASFLSRRVDPYSLTFVFLRYVVCLELQWKIEVRVERTIRRSARLGSHNVRRLDDGNNAPFSQHSKGDTGGVRMSVGRCHGAILEHAAKGTKVD